MLLVLQDVSVPYVLMPAGPGAQWVAHFLRQYRQIELHNHRGHLTRVHPHGLLPANFVGVRENRGQAGVQAGPRVPQVPVPPPLWRRVGLALDLPRSP